MGRFLNRRRFWLEFPIPSRAVFGDWEALDARGEEGCERSPGSRSAIVDDTRCRRA